MLNIINNEKPIRMGECNGCGWCCQFEGVQRNIVLPQEGTQKIDMSDRKFYELRGGITNKEETQVRYVAWVHLPCSAHDQTKKCCTIYDDRPNICRDFPQTPEQIEGTPCSYWFELKNGDKILRRGGQSSPYPSSPVFNGQ